MHARKVRNYATVFKRKQIFKITKELKVNHCVGFVPFSWDYNPEYTGSRATSSGPVAKTRPVVIMKEANGMH